MNWTQIIIALGGSAISGFFAFLSHKRACDAETHANNAAQSAKDAKTS